MARAQLERDLTAMFSHLGWTHSSIAGEQGHGEPGVAEGEGRLGGLERPLALAIEPDRTTVPSRISRTIGSSAVIGRSYDLVNRGPLW
jgi:hypothetical protein